MNEYNVNIHWDDESYVWGALSDDIPGLVLEAGSLDVLMERVKYVAPELLEANNRLPKEGKVFIKFNMGMLAEAYA
jgi:predicted RNase H-like HicB family nuclease